MRQWIYPFVFLCSILFYSLSLSPPLFPLLDRHSLAIVLRTCLHVYHMNCDSCYIQQENQASVTASLEVEAPRRRQSKQRKADRRQSLAGAPARLLLSLFSMCLAFPYPALYPCVCVQMPAQHGRAAWEEAPGSGPNRWLIGAGRGSYMLAYTIVSPFLGFPAAKKKKKSEILALLLLTPVSTFHGSSPNGHRIEVRLPGERRPRSAGSPGEVVRLGGVRGPRGESRVTLMIIKAAPFLLRGSVSLPPCLTSCVDLCYVPIADSSSESRLEILCTVFACGVQPRTVFPF